MIKRTRHLAAAVVAAVWLAGATALAAPAAQAVTRGAAGYTPGAAEWWLKDFQVQQHVWPLTEGAGVTVAVVDSGVQASVPDLRGVVLRGADMLGDPGNGDQDYATGQDGHGTTVAALIAGQGHGTGTVGIAPQAKILPVHAVEPQNEGSPPIGEGIMYAVSHGASVINLSVGENVSSPASCDPALQEAVAYALAHNVVVVAGSGDTNNGGPGPIEPASCAGVLAVGGIEPDLSLWPDSTQQPYVSVAAPGDHMAFVGMDGRFSATAGNGTSYSSPLVAGAAALIRSRYPSMPWYQVVQRLIGTAVPEGGKDPNNGYGYGNINPAKAVNASAYPVSASSPDPVYARYQAWLQTPGGQSWARANGVSTAPPPAPAQAGRPAGATPAASSHSGSGGMGATTIVAVAVVACIVLGGLSFLFLRSRMRPASSPPPPGGPHGPHGPGPGAPPGYGPPRYGAPPQQYRNPPPPQYANPPPQYRNPSPWYSPPPGYGPGGYGQPVQRPDRRPQDQDQNPQDG